MSDWKRFAVWIGIVAWCFFSLAFDVRAQECTDDDTIQLAQGQITIHKKLGTSNRVTGAVGGFGGPVSVPAAGGGGPDVYYYGSGNVIGAYTNTASLNGGDIFGDDVTITQAGTITTIGVKYAHDAGLDMNVKAALYRNNAGTWTLVTDGCKTTVLPDNDNVQTWIDFTLDTAYVASAGEVVRIMIAPEYGTNVSYAGTSNGMWITSNYATMCISTPTIETNDYQWAVRAYVD